MARRPSIRPRQASKPARATLDRMAYRPAFQEIAHCGGKVIVTVSTDANGRRGVSFGMRGSSPHPAAWFAVYALLQGIPVAMIQLGGIGQRWNPAPYQDCLPVFIGSDSLGLFGHQCSACEGYWRSKAVPALWNLTCPYCGMSGETHQFLTPGQRRFVEAVCELTMKAVNADTDGEHTIDMDQVADEVAKTNERPSFHYTEETQQNHYTCTACGGADDILGRYDYCSCCWTRNDLKELTLTIETINAKTRERIKPREPLETAVPDAVSAFDTSFSLRSRSSSACRSSWSAIVASMGVPGDASVSSRMGSPESVAQYEVVERASNERVMLR